MHSQNEIEKQVRTFRIIAIISIIFCLPGFQRIYIGGGGNLIMALIQLLLAPIWFLLIWIFLWAVWALFGSSIFIILIILIVVTFLTAFLAAPFCCLCGVACGCQLLVCPLFSCICLISAILPCAGEILGIADVINAETIVAKKHFIMRRDRMLETADPDAGSASFNEPFVARNRGSFGAKFADFSAAGAFGGMDTYTPPTFTEKDLNLNSSEPMKFKFNGVPEGVNMVSFNTEKNEESEMNGPASPSESQISTSMQAEIRDVEANILRNQQTFNKSGENLIQKAATGVLLSLDEK